MPAEQEQRPATYRLRARDFRAHVEEHGRTGEERARPAALQAQVPRLHPFRRRAGPHTVGDPEREARDDAGRLADKVERKAKRAPQGDQMSRAADGVGRQRQHHGHRQ
jgi:hypothetical protein